MNKRQKLVQQQFLNNEEAVIKRLKNVYDQSLKDINEKSRKFQAEIMQLQSLIDDEEDETRKATLKSMQQSKIYQKQYQDALKKQINSILDNMQVEEFKTVADYLNKCYEEGFIGTMYDLQGQGIPLCFPIDQEALVRAVQTDSKISQGLYTRLGEDVDVLKKKITAQVSRGISTGMSWQQVAQQLSNYTNIGYNNAVRIARTEGHRVQVQSAMDACYKAKDMGADVVKQWDASLDKRTRDSHAKVDGEIRELDKPFSNGLMFPSDPNGGAAEVVNCRCALLQRAKWALDKKELETLKERAAYYGLDKADSFDVYKNKYIIASKTINAPNINDKRIINAQKDFKSVLKNSKGERKHINKMSLYAENTEYKEQTKVDIPFLYSEKFDAIYYNPKVSNIKDYDLNYVQAHELTHRMDILEYKSYENKAFTKAIEKSKKTVSKNANKIQQYFVEGGKYENDFAMSDIISALSYNEIDVPIGHGNDYWDDERNVSLEVFANISAIDVLETESKKEFNAILKDLYSAYKEIVK